MNEDIFNTQEEEIRRLAEEIRGTREVLSDLSRTLTKIENRFQRAFHLFNLDQRTKEGSALHQLVNSLS